MMKFLALLMFVLVSLSCEKGNYSYQMPEDDYMYTDVVISSEPESYTEIIQNQMHAADKMEQWNEWRARYEAADKYYSYKKTWSDVGYKDIEAELESYCDSLFSNSCLLNMKEHCDRNGCREVQVTCERYRDSDEVCVRHKVRLLGYSGS